MGEFHRLYPNMRFFVEQSDSRTVMENILSQKGELGLTGYKMNNSLSYELSLIHIS